MGKRKLAAWQRACCELCGDEFQAARADPVEVDGDLLCSWCESSYERGYNDGVGRQKRLNTPEPDLVPNDSPPVWDLVIADMRKRDQESRRKYGVPLQAGNGRDALVDAYQEALGLCVYLRQAIEATEAAERGGEG